MVKNLKARGCTLMSLPQYPSTVSQTERYRNLGWKAASAQTMNQFYERTLGQDADEMRRLQRVEMLDEVEELQVLGKALLFAVSVGAMLTECLPPCVAICDCTKLYRVRDCAKPFSRC